MKNSFLILILFLMACSIERPISTADSGQSSPLLFRIGNDSTFTDEFIYVYRKNNRNNPEAFTREDISDYLRLYENFKLKVHEARARGMDTSTAYLNEMKAYEAQLKKPYLTETAVTEQLIQEAYERYSEEIRASHILIQVQPDAPPEDTLVAYERIQDIRRQALSGGSFSSLAARYSEDPSAARNGGDLEYFTSLQMVYPFENAAYSTPVDSISPVIRSQFGYHIIKVTDRRPANDKVSVSHIMIRHDPSDSLAGRNKIFEIYDLARGGADWDQLVNEYSEDLNSKRTGGRLQTFGIRQMPFAFQEAAMALAPGEISDPVRTPYGWHIIRMEQRIPLPGPDQMESSIRTRVENDERADLGRQALLDRLKQEWNARPIASFSAPLDLEDSLSLFQIGDSIYTTPGYRQFISQRGLQEGEKEDALLQEYFDSSLVAFEEAHLEEKYVDYRMLLREYREGILLFQLMDDEIWSRAASDSAGLYEYFEAHRDEYREPDQYRVTRFRVNDSQVQDTLAYLAANNAEGALGDLLRQYEGEGIVKSEAITLSAETLGSDVRDGEYVHTEEGMVRVEEFVGGKTPVFQEIRGKVIADYQNYLESEWIGQLRATYNVILNEDGLEHVYKELVR